MNDKRIAVITGGSRGLGRSAALHLAKLGVDTLFTYREDKVSADSAVAEIERAGAKAIALQLDLGKTSAFPDFAGAVKRSLADTFGRERFDFLVNNAGSGLHQSFAETTEAELDAMYQQHFKAPFLLTQKLLPLLADGGRILNVSTGLARFTMPGYSAYASMKGAIEVLTRYQAKELGKRQISVNTIAPGAIETDFGGGGVRDNPQLNAMVASATALGRVGKPDDVGGAIATFLTGDVKWMNAQRIELSGGQGL